MSTTGKTTDLGSVLRSHRENLGLSREEVAVHVRRGAQTVIEWERNKRVPSLAHLGQLAGLFGVSVGELAKADVGPPVRTQVRTGGEQSR